MTRAVPTFGIPNHGVPQDSWVPCHHCGNSGMVHLDGENVGAPCPMCQKGMKVDAGGTSLVYDRDKNRYLVAKDHGQAFWLRNDLAALTWENGLTMHHTRHCPVVQADGRKCPRPARDRQCDYHLANRPGVVGSVRTMVRSVGNDSAMTNEEATA